MNPTPTREEIIKQFGSGVYERTVCPYRVLLRRRYTANPHLSHQEVANYLYRRLVADGKATTPFEFAVVDETKGVELPECYQDAALRVEK